MASVERGPPWYRFNSKLVRLKVRVKTLDTADKSFNSKLVRLKALTRRGGGGAPLEFQFQTGAIKRTYGYTVDALEVMRFNSKLVRLKEGASSMESLNALKFQFQTGAIKSNMRVVPVLELKLCFNSKLVRLKVGVNYASAREACFNSKLVRLKADCSLDRAAAIGEVSIPNWCD